MKSLLCAIKPNKNLTQRRKRLKRNENERLRIIIKRVELRRHSLQVHSDYTHITDAL